ncbi:uncharacterized protein LOC118458070 isoform X1 [Anopheles albimanus]|uniref:uncharacterized protein LOC118458070 isoform X1 n=1 Tax=Anopheles albimanus TaxID=7167 RepID=UPI00163DEDFC|nr:uncharacterized protein LOC118458070 isoform X1 [Anopheles albimanus]XP_035776114.1 uncharacterized protein LOC118458070 isoform X1 [Anopheles albimanus]
MGMGRHHQAVTIAIVLLSCCSIRSNANISPQVIATQQALYGELQLLEQSPLHSELQLPSDENPRQQSSEELRFVFQEFERQNQESLTSILQVLALVDQTLENTVLDDCAKIFDLSSLDRNNAIFRQVTWPLLVQVEQLCQLLASEQLDQLETTMERVEREATIYRKRLDETQKHMRAVRGWLDGREPAGPRRLEDRVDELYSRWLEANTTVHREVPIVIDHIIGTLSSAIEESHGGINNNVEEDPTFRSIIDNFALRFENETNELAAGLLQLLDEWLDQTEELIDVVSGELIRIVDRIVEIPVTAFLRGETTLDCLAEQPGCDSVNSMRIEVENIYDCFSGEGDVLSSLAIAKSLLELTEREVRVLLQGLAHCTARRSPPEMDAFVTSVLANCSDAASTILEGAGEFVTSKMNEIYNHFEDMMNFSELKMEACLYGKARELVLNICSINQHYQQCNLKNASPQIVPAGPDSTPAFEEV